MAWLHTTDSISGSEAYRYTCMVPRTRLTSVIVRIMRGAFCPLQHRGGVKQVLVYKRTYDTGKLKTVHRTAGHGGQSEAVRSVDRTAYCERFIFSLCKRPFTLETPSANDPARPGDDASIVCGARRSVGAIVASRAMVIWCSKLHGIADAGARGLTSAALINATGACRGPVFTSCAGMSVSGPRRNACRRSYTLGRRRSTRAPFWPSWNDVWARLALVCEGANAAKSSDEDIGT